MGVLGARNGRSPTASRVALLVAAGCGVLALLVALARHWLGAPAASGFLAILLSPMIITARLAGQSSPALGVWLAGGVLLLGAGWHLAATFLGRRAQDAIIPALLALQLFWLAVYINSLLPSAGALSWSALVAPQKINLVLSGLLLLALLAAWTLRPPSPTPFDASAPSRITGFLKKRRMRSRLLGAILMALAIFIIGRAYYTSLFLPKISPAPIAIMAAFLFGNAIYWGGKKLWQRL